MTDLSVIRKVIPPVAYTGTLDQLGPVQIYAICCRAEAEQAVLYRREEAEIAEILIW